MKTLMVILIGLSLVGCASLSSEIDLGRFDQMGTGRTPDDFKNKFGEPAAVDRKVVDGQDFMAFDYMFGIHDCTVVFLDGKSGGQRCGINRQRQIAEEAESQRTSNMWLAIGAASGQALQNSSKQPETINCKSKRDWFGNIHTNCSK